MTEITENKPAATRFSDRPMLQINRLNYVKISAKILDATDQRLKDYLRFATEQMDTEVANDDVIEYALNMLFDRDAAFKSWLKRKA